MDTTPFTRPNGLTRRRMLGTALALGAAAPLGLASTARAADAPSPAPAPTPGRITLPEPTGPHRVGTVALHLRDTSRPDPFAGPGRYRELMASVWYPAQHAGDFPLAPWMTDGALKAFLDDQNYPLPVTAGPLTAGHVGAPVHRFGQRLPVVVYSHGAHANRAANTITVQELASHGYVVVTVDHTWDAFTEFPDGRVLTPWIDGAPNLSPRDYAADARFVLDCVEELAAGRNPDVDGKALPDGLLGAPDPLDVGMFGWSKGGSATAAVIMADRRVRAGLSIDGPMGGITITDVDRPFLMLTAEFGRDQNPNAVTFWNHLRGWRLNIQADGVRHLSYEDAAVLIPQVGKLLGIPEQQVQQMVGTLPADSSTRIQQAYPLAFFDLHLRHRRGSLLDGPSPRFPEVRFLP
ncbi:alpha/beta hydrolase family protein [Kitasatospora cathayae]|uniref:Acetylhydrolase n=1 Tax=Kitasatospora cathayae TaxID=3004092 RepID=A0ABY7Q0Y1_9ACTN|nr:acetylhydrolase [Kitasatospora sp. HUAS 3-15]WBP86092.1 acetylhydrolase [Kitasatospora sp. HUAS 3-15]